MKRTKFFALFLAVIMLIGMVPVTVFAAGDEKAATAAEKEKYAAIKVLPEYLTVNDMVDDIKMHVIGIDSKGKPTDITDKVNLKFDVYAGEMYWWATFGYEALTFGGTREPAFTRTIELEGKPGGWESGFYLITDEAYYHPTWHMTLTMQEYVGADNAVVKFDITSDAVDLSVPTEGVDDRAYKNGHLTGEVTVHAGQALNDLTWILDDLFDVNQPADVYPGTRTMPLTGIDGTAGVLTAESSPATVTIYKWMSQAETENPVTGAIRFESAEKVIDKALNVAKYGQTSPFAIGYIDPAMTNKYVAVVITPSLRQSRYSGFDSEWDMATMKINSNPSHKYSVVSYTYTERQVTLVVRMKKCDHSNRTMIPAVARTCTTDGNMAYCICDDCGAYTTVAGTERAASTFISPAYGHNWGDGHVTTQSQVGKKGVMTYTCARCGETRTEDIPPLPGPHEHAYTTTIVVEPYCETEGYTRHICDCGEEYADSYMTPLSHIGGNATCTEPAVCERCGNAYGQPDTANHTHTHLINVKDATCAEGGYTGDLYCEDCGKTVQTGLATGALGHSVTKVEAKAASCTTPGRSAYYTCERCGKWFVDENGTMEITDRDITLTIPALGHDWNNGVVAKEPTDLVPGVRTYTCYRCHQTKSEEIPKLTHYHDYTETKVVAPTCTEQGYTLHTCRCGDSFKDSYVKAKGHTPGKAATCTEDQCCTVCGKTVQKALGHSYRDEVVKPTCTEVGYTTHTCTRCGNSYSDHYTDPLHHNWDKGVVTKQPTETVDGIRTYTCTRCNQTRTEAIPSAGHVHVYTDAVVDPTCTADGYTVHTCACGDSYTDTVVKAKGHQPGAKATCTTDQYCRVCGEVLQRKLGHSYTETVTEPTCTEDGCTVHTCERCGDSYTDCEVKAVGHEWDEGVVVREATISATGLLEYSCKQCGGKKQKTTPCKASDEKTGVVIEADEGVFAEGTVVVVEPISESDERVEMAKEELADVAEEIVVYDIKAVMDDAVVQPNGKVKITLPVPEGFGSDVALYYIHDDGTAEKLESSVNADGTISADLDHFSMYAVCKVVAEPAETDPLDPQPDTEQNSMWLMIAVDAAIVVVAVLAVVLVLKRKKK